jgi:hypothetical protein
MHDEIRLKHLENRKKAEIIFLAMKLPHCIYLSHTDCSK